MQTSEFRRHALLPKPELSEREAADYHESIATGLGALAPAERRALAAIVEAADLIEVPGAPQHLLVEVTPEIVETLSQFGAELEGLEPSEDDEDLDQDDDSANDNAVDSIRFDPAIGIEVWAGCDFEPSDSRAPRGARKSAEAFFASHQKRRRRLGWRWRRDTATVCKALLKKLKKPARLRWRTGLTGRADGPVIRAR